MLNRMFDFTRKSTWRNTTGIAVVLALVGFGAAEIAAQNTGTVTGLVLDNSVQIPLAGAQMTVDGTPIGGLVNNTGRYLLLNVPAGEQTITAQIIGYGTQTLTVTVVTGETATLDFNLRQEALSLEGVIVTGTAGAARRKEIGNAISAVSAADIEVAAVTDFGDILQGRTAGVQINDHGGQVGSGSQIRIRGNNSLTQGNDPLIYIDGVRMENGQIGYSDEAAQEPNVFDMINPSDIDRIEIVKGPAATTLYGTEAAGGVIQIFTKRGAAGAPAWTLSIDQGTSIMPHAGPTGLGSTYDERFPDIGSAGGWLLPPNEVVNPFGLNLNDCSSPRAWAPNGEPGCPENGSWFRPGYKQDYNLSVRGGGETATYFVSGRFGKEIGTIQTPEEYDPQGADDYQVRGNIQFTPTDGLQISLNNSYARRKITWIPNGNNASGLYLNVIRGPAGYTPGNDDSLVLENDVNQTIDHVVTSASIGWTPNNMFSHRLNVGMDYTISDFVDFKAWGYYEEFQGDRESDTQTDRNLTLDYNGTFSYDLFSGITSNFSWGGQMYEEYGYGINGFDELFAGPGEQLLGNGNNPRVWEGRTTIRSGGFFAQETLGFGDRLFLTAGMRWDGFSTFGEGFGLAAYPKISAAYTVSDEAWWFFDAVEIMKVRAAWGQSGKAPGAFDAKRIYEAISADEQVPGVIIGNLGNADLGPELSTELEAGFEMSAMEGRVSVDFTWYNQVTNDALIGVQEAPSGGTEEATLRNLGETKNWGTETSINLIPVTTENFEWSFGLNYSTNDSEVTDLGPLTGGSTVRTCPDVPTDEWCKTHDGYPLFFRWDDRIANPGVLGELPVKEKAYLGHLYPTSMIGGSTRMTFARRVTFDVLFESQRGFVRPIGPAYQNVRRRQWPMCQPIADVWYNGDRSTLTSTQVGMCVGPYADWGYWTDDASFIKLRSATLSWRLPEGWVPGARTAQISLQGKNLWTHAPNYRGLDPEANDRRRSAMFEYYNAAPPRVFLANIQINF